MDRFDGLESEGVLRETRRMRATRVAQNGEMSQLSVTAAEDRAGSLEPGDFRPQETKVVSYWPIGLHGD